MDRGINAVPVAEHLCHTLYVRWVVVLSLFVWPHHRRAFQSESTDRNSNESVHIGLACMVELLASSDALKNYPADGPPVYDLYGMTCHGWRAKSWSSGNGSSSKSSRKSNPLIPTCILKSLTCFCSKSRTTRFTKSMTKFLTSESTSCSTC